MNTRERTHLKRAIEISRQSTCKQKHGAVIAIGARVMAVAVNQDRANPNVCTDPKTEASWHAEVAALRQLRGVDLSRAAIYSARTNSRGEPMLAEPCSRCAEAIRAAGIRKVIWTD